MAPRARERCAAGAWSWRMGGWVLTRHDIGAIIEYDRDKDTSTEEWRSYHEATSQHCAVANAR